MPKVKEGRGNRSTRSVASPSRKGARKAPKKKGTTAARPKPAVRVKGPKAAKPARAAKKAAAKVKTKVKTKANARTNARARTKTKTTTSGAQRPTRAKRTLEPVRGVKIRALDPVEKCGPGTSVQQLFRVDESIGKDLTTHLVFFDRHGWYCEHGRTCRAVADVQKLGKRMVVGM